MGWRRVKRTRTTIPSYRVELTHPARKELGQLPPKDRVRIVAAIDLLQENPRPPKCRVVQAAPKGTCRVRVGDYRIVYVIQDEVLLITVVRIVRGNERTYKGIG